jgi:hypothetical protein
MKRFLFSFLFILSLSFFTFDTTISIANAQSFAGPDKACVITIYVPNEHIKYECKGTGEACGNVLNCL